VDWMKNAPPSDARTEMRAAYTDSLRVVYIVMAVLSLAATVMSLFVKHYNLDRPLETDQYLMREEKAEEETTAR